MKTLQFVNWFPEWHGFAFLLANKKSDLRYIYDWFLYLGFWEIRKWHKLTDKDRDALKGLK